MQNRIVWNITDDLFRIDSALNLLQRLICRKTQETNQTMKLMKCFLVLNIIDKNYISYMHLSVWEWKVIIIIKHLQINQISD